MTRGDQLVDRAADRLQELADEFARWLESPGSIEPQALR